MAGSINDDRSMEGADVNDSGHARAVQNRDEQIRHRRVFRKFQMPAALQLARRAACHQYRQRRMIVHVTVAHPAAIKDQRVIQQAAVAEIAPSTVPQPISITLSCSVQFFSVA